MHLIKAFHIEKGTNITIFNCFWKLIDSKWKKLSFVMIHSQVASSLPLNSQLGISNERWNFGGTSHFRGSKEGDPTVADVEKDFKFK